MSERRKGFAKRKGDISPAACVNVKWCGAAWSLPLRWTSGKSFGERCHGSGQVVEQSALIGSVRLFHLFPLTVKSENRSVNFEQRTPDSGEFRSNWLKGGFLAYAREVS